MAEAQIEPVEELLLGILRIQARCLAPGQLMLVYRAVEDPHVIQWTVSAMNRAPISKPPSFTAGGEANALPEWAAAVADPILEFLGALGQTAAGVAQWLMQLLRNFLGAVGQTVLGVLGALVNVEPAEQQPLHPHGLTHEAVRTVLLIVLIAVLQHRRS
ncbi:hypothetical protein HXX76_011018 [Chlamydomonas incerta]|uniref:Uncharacterized protein n=1 Tax=Chlamydomonas incerta TaxID=51695 RepID=A0A835SLK3_CHLIN|nr:hypothetical protein HXX76_011018 [Chlamydomonas incerta]|eukprot:KAG2429249.1 hypothetical protein HXX76_011018 [Chlamydomonas incerta]